MVKRECFLKKELKSALLFLHLCVTKIQLNIHKSNIYNMYYMKEILKLPSIKYLVYILNFNILRVCPIRMLLFFKFHKDV